MQRSRWKTLFITVLVKKIEGLKKASRISINLFCYLSAGSKVAFDKFNL